MVYNIKATMVYMNGVTLVFIIGDTMFALLDHYGMVNITEATMA